MIRFTRVGTLVCLLLFASLCTASASRQVVLAGIVTDALSAKPLADVNVYIKDSSYGCTTDKNGKYHLRVSVPDKAQDICVRVQMLGYKAQERSLNIGDRAELVADFALVSDACDLEGVVVTGTRTEKTLANTPIVTQVIDYQEIQRISAPSVKELLEYRIPGVEFSTHGGNVSIKMQGFDAGYILFLIDGEEVSGGNGGNIDLQRITPEQIERVEIVRGAGSALYGSNAVAGVINIITKNNLKPRSLLLSAGYSHPKQFNSYASLGLRNKRISSTTTTSYDDAGDYKLYDRSEDRYQPIFRNRMIRIAEKLSWRPSEAFSLRAAISASERKQYRNEYRHDYYRTLNSNLIGAYQIDEKRHLSITYNQDATWRLSAFPKDKEADKPSTIYRNALNMIRTQYDWAPTKAHSINAGVEYHHEAIRSFQIKEYGQTETLGYAVLFAQHSWEIVPSLSLLYGARADQHSAYGLHFSPKIGLMYRPGRFALRAGYAHAFKAPSAMELYYDWSHQGMFMIYGNRDLKPETANQGYLSAEYTRRKLSLSVSAQYTAFHDKIAMLQDPKGNMHFANIAGQSPLFGIESNIAWRPCQAIRITGNYAFVNDRTTRKLNGIEYAASYTRPHALTAALSYLFAKDWYRIDASLLGRYHSKLETHRFRQDENSQSPVVVPTSYEDYAILRLVVTQRFFDRYGLIIGIDNLLNYRTDQVSSLAPLTPGLGFFAKATIDL